VAGFRDERLSYVYQSNRGVSAALNSGLRAARGKYLAMLGSDDAMLPDQVETLLRIADESEQVGVVYARGQGMDESGRDLPQTFGAPLRFPGQPLPSMLYANTVCAIACLVRREIVVAVGGFDEGLIANEDWDLWLRLAPRCQFAYCDRILARYRLHPESLTAASSTAYEQIIRGRIALIEGFYAREPVPADALAVKKLALRNVYMDAMIRRLTLGQNRAALADGQRALRAGGNPLAGSLRLVSVALFDLYFSKKSWAVRLTDHLVARRRPDLKV
jgi:glycosyltransferase involved in cell wall biosynthesis